jgi:translation initiation factor 2D
MVLPSHLVEGGTKGKALTLLHAWKDQLWVIGGEERPPRPRLLESSLDGEVDEDEEWASDDVDAGAKTQSKSSNDGDTLKQLSPEGVYHK